MSRSLRSIVSRKRPLRRGEERLLGILHHLRELKQTWENKMSAQSALSDIQSEIERIEQEIESLSQSAPEKVLDFSEAFKQSKSIFLAGGAVVSLGLGIALANNQDTKESAPWFYFFGAGAGIAALAKTNGAIKQSRSEFEASSTNLKELKDELTQKRRVYSETSKAFRANNITLPEVTLGTALLPLQSTQVLNKSLLLHTGNLVKPAKLQSVALRDLSNEAESILGMTQELDAIPVLLAPDDVSISESRESNATLHGEERSLKDAVSRYVQTLASISDEEINIPAVRPDSDLGRALQAVIDDNELISKQVDDSSITMEIEGNDATLQQNLQSFEQLHSETENASQTAIPQLEQINTELKQLCDRYRFARTTSTNALHLNYEKVLSRANWSSRSFYCPRTILSKDYLQGLIQLDFDEAHNATADDLVQALQSDSFINSRLSSKPQLLEELLKSHTAVHELISSYQLNPDTRGTIRVGAAAEHIADQFKQELNLFRQRLVEALTGSPNGFLGISESARVYFDPERDLWSSPVLPYTYTTSEVEQYGQVRRTDVDLLIPLWEHLWTEKADFRKSELFRTNEAIQRMSEKEGEKIKQIGYQFQADLREVRSNMLLAKADFDAKLKELSEYEDDIKGLGLMEKQQEEKLKAATQELEATSTDAAESNAEGYEFILMQEPTNQLLLRQSGVHDPIDVVKSTDLLIEGGADKGVRRLNYLGEGGEVQE